MDDDMQQNAWALAELVERLTPQVEVREGLRDKGTLSADIDVVHETKRALDNGLLQGARVANVHHANMLVKTKDDRWFFVGMDGAGEGVSYTEFCEIKNISPHALEGRTEFWGNNQMAGRNKRHYWIKSAAGKPPASPKTVGDLLGHMDKHKDSHPYRLLSDNCQHATVAGLGFLEIPPSPKGPVERMGLKVAKVPSSNRLDSKGPIPPDNLEKRFSVSYQSGTLLIAPCSARETRYTLPRLEHRCDAEDHGGANYEQVPPAYDIPPAGNTPPAEEQHEAHTSFKFPTEPHPNFSVGPNNGGSGFVPGALCGAGVAGMTYSGATATICNGLALTLKGGIALSASGSPMATAGFVLTATNPAGLASLGLIFLGSTALVTCAALTAVTTGKRRGESKG